MKSKLWLVKSATKIHGPLTTEQVIEDLFNHSFSVVDEAISPRGCWGLIREHPDFFDSVKRLRTLPSGNEDTATATIYSQKTQTISLRQTQSQTHSPAQSAPVSSSQGQTQAQNSAQFKDVTSTAQEGTKQEAPVTFVTPDVFRRKAEKQSSNFLAISIAILIAVVGGLWYYNKQKTMVALNSGFDDILKKANKEKASGLYQQALQTYKKALALRPKDEELGYQVAPLLLTVDNQTAKAKQMFEMSLQTRSKDSKDLTSELYTGLGMAFQAEGNLTTADEYYNKALTLNNLYIPALINRGQLKYKIGSFNESYDLFTKADEQGSRDFAVTIGKVLAGTKIKTPKLLQDLEDLRRRIDRTYDFRQEMWITYLGAMADDLTPEDLRKFFTEAISVDPEMTSLFVHDLSVDRKLISWNVFGSICMDITNRFKEDGEKKATRAWCQAKLGQDLEAKMAMTAAQGFAPKNFLVLFVSAYLARFMGNLEEARAILAVNLKDEPSEGVRALYARTCEDLNDSDCALTQWNKVLEIAPDNPLAILSMVNLSNKKGAKEEVSKWINKGMNRSSNFRPFVEFREKSGL